VGNFLFQFLTALKEKRLPAYEVLMSKLEFSELSFEKTLLSIERLLKIGNEAGLVTSFVGLGEDVYLEAINDPCMRLTILTDEEISELSKSFRTPKRVS
jgi:hypothetical protein